MRVEVTLRRFALVLSTAAGLGLAAAAEPDTLRMGFTNAMFAGVNESDAKASVRALATTIARERGLPADPEPHLFQGCKDAAAGLQRETVNTIGLTAAEYATLRTRVAFDGFVFGVFGDDPTETYVVLTSVADNAKTLADLRGRDLAVLIGPRMSVALDWLDVELHRQGLPPTAEFFRRRISSGKTSKVVLPVFFKQIAACLVTRRAFDTMAELNPQVRRQLRVISASPPYVPSLFALRRGFSGRFFERVLIEFNQLHTTPAGSQVLTIFQTDQVTALPEATLTPTVAMLEEHSRIVPDAGAPRRSQSSP